MLTINEVFHSIQGESSHAGRPCVFVRLTACDLRCTWCDSAYAFYEGVKRTLDEVVDEAVAFGCPLVEVTGGEPLLQKDVYPLIERLHDAGMQVLIETGGHRSIADVPDHATVIMDVKCPGSGEAAKHDAGNFARLRAHDEVKFVIRDRADYDYARDVVRARVARRPGGGDPLLAGARRSSTRRRCRRGCWPTACRCGCSSRSTSTSGAPTCAASDASASSRAIGRAATCSMLAGETLAECVDDGTCPTSGSRWPSVRRRPGVPLMTAGLFALSVGLAGGLWAVVDAVALRPLPYPNAHELVAVMERHPERGLMSVTPANFWDWSSRLPAFAARGGPGQPRGQPRRARHAARVTGTKVTERFFDVLGVRSCHRPALRR